MKLKLTLTKTYYFERQIEAGHIYNVQDQFNNYVNEALHDAEVQFINEMEKVIANKEPLIMGHSVKPHWISNLDVDYKNI